MTSTKFFDAFSLVVTRGHSWSTRGHSWSTRGQLVVTRGHSCVLLDTTPQLALRAWADSYHSMQVITILDVCFALLKVV